MSLPSGFLDELRARVSLTSVVGRKVQWDQRKSNQGKGDKGAPVHFIRKDRLFSRIGSRRILLLLWLSCQR